MSNHYMDVIDSIYGVAVTPEWKCTLIDGESPMEDLKELKEYWGKKYPEVLVILWSNPEGTAFKGKMMTSEHNQDISAYSMADLIDQGEAFLRKVG
jgi:hypothetical protein